MSRRPFDYTRSEIIAGAFVLTALALLGYLSISIGGFTFLPEDRYQVLARFSNVGDLKPGAPIKVAGVTIGEVEAIRLADYFGEVTLAVDHKVVLPRDTIASIATAGLLGDAYVSLSPGAAEENLGNGQRITRSEPALNLADLLGRYAFGAASNGEGSDQSDDAPAPIKPAPAPTGATAPAPAKEILP
jgi:phospholipid/cholesterol/gamma-HCH transport system substrate-binding protein